MLSEMRAFDNIDLLITIREREEDGEDQVKSVINVCVRLQEFIASLKSNTP